MGRLPNLESPSITTSDVIVSTTNIVTTKYNFDRYVNVMDEEYILRWNDHGISFFALAEDLLQQELLTDVTIWCGDRVFDAHRLVLCACSPLFRAMLTRQPPRLSRSDQQPIVFLRDINSLHFERLLQFMYCGEVRVPNNELDDLLAAATSLKVRGLATSGLGNNSLLSQQPRVQQQAPPHPSASVPTYPQSTPVAASNSVEAATELRLHQSLREAANDQQPHQQQHHQPAAPPKKRRLSRDCQNKKFPLSTLDGNRILKNTNNSNLASSLNNIANSAHSPELLRGKCN